MKHNTANGENNRDGTDANWSWNSGEEGKSNNEVVIKNRNSRMRAMLATLMFSFGTPMITFGDEFGRSQMGNNNPYCQDNAITWIAWEGLSPKQRSLISYTRKLIRLRKKLKIFNRNEFFTGKEVDEKGNKDLAWYTEKGIQFTSADWHDGSRRCLSYLLKTDSGFVQAIFNANHTNIEWKLPSLKTKYKWNLLFDSSDTMEKDIKMGSGKIISVPSWSVLLIEIKK